MNINLEEITLGELFELHELRELDLSSTYQIARRGELIAKIFGPETQLEEMTKNYLDIEVKLIRSQCELYDMRQKANALERENAKLSAHIQQLKNQIHDAEPPHGLA
jgi:multidrug resistance efflux pump